MRRGNRDPLCYTADHTEQSADHDVRTDQRHDRLDPIHRQLVELLVLRSVERPGMLPDRPAEDDLHASDVLAGNHVRVLGRGPRLRRLSSESAPPEIWLDWDQSTDNVDPQLQISYQVFLNGELDHVAFGIGETITYCPGPTTIQVNAVDTSGNTSAPSNQILFDC